MSTLEWLQLVIGSGLFISLAVLGLGGHSALSSG